MNILDKLNDIVTEIFYNTFIKYYPLLMIGMIGIIIFVMAALTFPVLKRDQPKPENLVLRVHQVDLSNTVIVEMVDGTEYICINENTKCQLVKD